jgi:tetratricopeptide (TPR) repeat protein
MARDQKIIFNSELYKLGVKQFDANLEQILEIFSVRNIPVFLSTLVSNEKDLKPMLSERTGQNIDDKQWDEKFATGEKLLLNGDTVKAYKIFSDLNKVDSTYALTHYYLGRIAYKAGKFSEAKACFKNASELDALRFRGPEQMNEIIRKKAGEFKNVILVDTKKAFEANSSHGIVGNELILEHLHPNLKGYFVISVAFYNALKASMLLSLDWGNEIQSEKIYRELPITLVDSLYGLYGTWFLKEGWPFNEPMPEEEKREKTFEEKLAGGLVTRQVKWGEAMNALYEQYLKESNFLGALKITEGLILEFPYDARLYSRALKLANELKYYDLANYYGRKGFLLDSNFEFARALFINYLKIDKPDLAMPFIDFCIKNNNGSVNLQPLKEMVDEILASKSKIDGESTQIGYLKKIAHNYFMMGNYEAAIKYIKVVLQTWPDDKETLNLVTEIRKEGFKEI